MPYTSITRRGVTLLCFPPQDAALQGLALRMLVQLTEMQPARLQARLREWYPQLTVRRRHDLADLGPAIDAWYVYRDGRYSPFSDDGEWWRDGAAARLVIADDGRYLAANETALALLNVTPDQVARHRSGDFTTEAAAVGVPWIFELLRQTGALHSTAVLRPAGGGAPIGVEFHFELNADGPGRHVSWMRQIPIDRAS